MCMGENFKIEYGSRYVIVWDSSSKHTKMYVIGLGLNFMFLNCFQIEANSLQKLLEDFLSYVLNSGLI